MDIKFNTTHKTLTLISLFCLISYLVLTNQTFSKQKTDNLPQIQQKENNPQLDKSFGKIPVYFEENRGQFNSKVKYFTRGTSGYSLFLTATEAVYLLQEKMTSDIGRGMRDKVTLDSRPETHDSLKGTAVYMSLVGANENSSSVGLEEMPHKTNYFKGEESNWRTEIPNFKQIRMDNIYQGIDAVWYGKANGGVQYDFVVEPNADPDQIEWKIEGADSIEIDEQGDLLIKTEFGTIRQQKPFTYQNDINGFRQEIESKFIITAESKIKFEVGYYDHSKTLIIDPTVNLGNLAFSTFLGGNSQERGEAIAIDQEGNLYVTGQTQSISFPTTPGTFDTTYNDQIDVFVTKLNPMGSALIYSTFLGGSVRENGLDIAVDSSGNAFISGATKSVDYPTTSGAFDETPNGEDDVIVTKLNPTGSALVYSTLIGGNGRDRGWGITVDLFGNAYVTGDTSDGTIDYPTTIQTVDGIHNGNFDAFVTKINPTGSSLVFSTFLGGSSDEAGYGIAIDAFGNVLVTGYSASTGYPTTTGAFDSTHNSIADVIVTKLNSTGSALIYSTFVGGNSAEIGADIAVDDSGNAFVTGNVGSSDFPTTPGAFDTTHNGVTDAFVIKLTPNGTGLFYSTFLGSSGFDYGNSITVDASGNAFLTGQTPDATVNFPTSTGAYERTHNGDIDVFVTKLNATGSALDYSTFIGGGSSDVGNGIVIDNSGNIYITGETLSSGIVSQEYPTTAGAFQTFHNGSFDAFISKLGGFSSSAADFDFDGDGKTDIGIFRPAPGEWWYLRSSDSGNYAVQFGNSSDTTVPADFTGDGKTDIAFWRNGEWFILRSEDQTFFSFPFGATGDIPAPGDFDGDGIDDAAVFRPSTSNWFILNSGGGTTITTFGIAEDKPVVGDYDGDGKDDVAIYRPSNSQWWLNRSTDGVLVFQFGQTGDQTVHGDYTGDGKDDVAFWRPASGEWFVIRSEDQSFFSFPFGASTDIPVPGDYDGDGSADAAVFRPSTTTWFLNGSTSGTQILGFGLNTDVPIANSYVYE